MLKFVTRGGALSAALMALMMPLSAPRAQSQSDVAAQISTQLPDNGRGSITASGLRGVFNAMNSARGVANGIATLDGNGVLPASQLPPITISPINGLNSLINAARTISVCSSGCDFAAPLDAWNTARGLVILGAFTTVTIQIADGTYNLNAPVYTSDPATAAVSFRGNCNSPANVVLNFTNISGTNAGGFVADGGGALGRPGTPGVDCMIVNGVGARTGRSTWTDQSYGGGISAVGSGSRVYVGPKMTVQNFYYSAIADHAGYILANGATFLNAGDVNVLARFSATIKCLSCTMRTASHIFTDAYGNSQTLGFNGMAEANASLYMDNSTVSDAQVSCVVAQTAAATWAHAVQASGCIASGARAIQNGFLELNNSRITTSAVGLYANSGGAANVDAVEIDHSTFDGISLDGGRAAGSNLKIHDNGGYGIKALKQSKGEFYNSLSNTLNNASGQYFVEPAAGCANNFSPCSPASAMIIN